jgi:hypothetical protein
LRKHKGDGGSDLGGCGSGGNVNNNNNNYYY